MKLGVKVLGLIALAVALYLLITHDESKVPEIRPSPAAVPVASPQEPKAKEERFFSVDDVKKLVWRDNGVLITLTRSRNNDWIASPPTAIDPWQVRRRLEVISHFAPMNINAASLSGGVTVVTQTKTLEGAFDDKRFLWLSKDIQGKGIDFGAQPLIGEAFDEGLLGFRPHEAKLCDAQAVSALSIQGSWSLEKSLKGWVTSKNGKTEPARQAAVGEFLTHVCKVKVDRFFRPLAHDQPIREALLIKSAQHEDRVMKSGNTYAYRDLTFSSEILDNLLKTEWDDIKDPASEEGRIALDPKQDMKTRTMAIRKVKENPSVSAIPWLKALVFENTDLDVYRYEAVDALASIGTKEAYKIIADRLDQEGRTGFQLRLARTLAAGMGRPFMSDEKTPDSERQAEVRELLEAYKKTPPGR